MDVDAAARTRINGKDISQFERRLVTLVGKVQSQDGREAVLVAPDSTEVRVQMGIGSMYPNVVEVTGTVDSSHAIREESFVGFPEDFDMDSYNEFLTLAHTKFTDIFLP